MQFCIQTQFPITLKYHSPILLSLLIKYYYRYKKTSNVIPITEYIARFYFKTIYGLLIRFILIRISFSKRTEYMQSVQE